MLYIGKGEFEREEENKAVRDGSRCDNPPLQNKEGSARGEGRRDGE